MKKLSVIILLVISLLSGGMVLDAKTTKKKAKTTQTANKETSLSVETFFTYDKQYDTYGYRDLSVIKSSLKKLGYSNIGTESAGYYEEEDGTRSPMVAIVFQKGSNKVYIYQFKNDRRWVNKIGIKFGSSTEKSSFISAAERKSKGGNNNLGVWQEGNMVFIGASEH